MAMAGPGVVPTAVCRFYRTSTGCRFGDRCWFRHSDGGDNSPLTTGTNPGSTRMCRFFLSPTGCRYGNSCHFRHITPESDERDIQELSTTMMSGLIIAGNIDDNDYDEYDNDENNNTSKDDSLSSPLLDDGKEDEEGEERTVTCGECKEVITSKNVRKALTRHYMSMFLAFDKPHTQFISQDWRFYREVMCDTCFIPFDNSLSMFRHICDKSKLKKRDGPEHRLDLQSIVHEFVTRDLGEGDDKVVTFKQMIMALLTEDDVNDDEGNFNPEDVEFYGRPLRQTSTLEKAKNLVKHQALDDERAENFGFTEDEVMELLCQGIKPWDPDAYDALNVLYDYH
ncbi:hypothetical protein LOTGIDRAFT_230469 [Lottia gigantea]|uniref:C3H1-type domain-containing protein n=1 Tax=Lottia gigantea TaxID=225164 RepID=V4AZ85_LOTGI|nr:hypothetical protein LOTGIDRAFT_230469 [Lottia gigantea]ESP03028.1 hypothetical protein LOTGIDRAFT_230469 [Lottia gigantea]